MSRSYRFTVDADRDLLRVWLDTELRWGEKQADKYMDALHARCQRIVEGAAAGKSFEGSAEISFYLCEHHYLFYTEWENTVVVIAVMHEHMDLPRRLADRMAGM
ncbi:type II toxin-antitoxin system RelE/ParE family toxin [Amorphus sp. 3PC139-8]|uniref:type II toxin-antitoxin system RelE/ParE family toxin n=1 Tax=Amorphus sp. 3PC139-8 TaxID=2735676 RepID=UPI00345CD548